MSHNTSGSKSLKEVKSYWFAHVKEAQAQYRQAFDRQKRLIEELDQALMKGADGSFAVEKAQRGLLALDELVRCQEMLVNLLLRPEIPPPDAVGKQTP